MLVLSSPQVTQETAFRWKRESPIAFVPTMGCLHEGHLALVRKARTFAKRVIVSIFVNPLQFGPGEDFEKYPRMFEEDCALLEKEGVDLVFHPTVQELYPNGFSAKLSMGPITERLCGRFRFGHFDGVATVCLKLFNITQADYAVFGEKDFQQLRIIQNMTRDLNLPISIIPHPTVRESDGLAISSRNRYLNESERRDASLLSSVLAESRALAIENGACRVSDILENAKKRFMASHLRPQYVEVTTGMELLPAVGTDFVNGLPMPHLFLAVYAGTTRLIDNVSLNGIHS